MLSDCDFFICPFFTSLFLYVVFPLAKYTVGGVEKRVSFTVAHMASGLAQGAPTLSLRNGCRCVPDLGVTVEDMLLAIGEKVRYEDIVLASRINKAVVVFFKSESMVNELTVSGIWVKGTFVPVTPLSAPATKVIISNIPPFVNSDTILKELQRLGKIASPVKRYLLDVKMLL